MRPGIIIAVILALPSVGTGVPAVATAQRAVVVDIPAHGRLRHTCCDCGLVHHVLIERVGDGYRLTWVRDEHETRRERRLKTWWREIGE